MNTWEQYGPRSFLCWCGRVYPSKFGVGACTHNSALPHLPHAAPLEPIQPDYEVADVSWREAATTLGVLAGALAFLFVFWVVFG